MRFLILWYPDKWKEHMQPLQKLLDIKFIIFCFKACFPLASKWRYLTIYFWATIFWFQMWTFPSSYIIKYRSISPDIVRHHTTEIAKVFDNYRQISLEFMAILQSFRCYHKMLLIKQKLRRAKHVWWEHETIVPWWEASVLKHNKLKIKIVEKKTPMNKSYIYQFAPHLFVPLLVMS